MSTSRLETHRGRPGPGSVPALLAPPAFAAFLVLTGIPWLASAQAMGSVAPDESMPEEYDPSMGYIAVLCDVPDAQIYVDGEFKGSLSSAARITVPAGRHLVTVWAEGYETVSKEASVPGGGGKYVSVTLVTIYEEVQVETPPEKETKMPSCKDKEILVEGQCVHWRAKKGWKGLLVGGYITLFLAVGFVGGGIGATPNSADFIFIATMVPFGLALGITSGFLLGYGYKYKRQGKELPSNQRTYTYYQIQKYKSWRGDLIAGYSMLAVSLSMFGMSLGTINSNHEASVAGAVSGSIALMIAVPFLVVGHTYRSKIMQYEKRQAGISLMPVVAPVNGGGMLGLSGTF